MCCLNLLVKYTVKLNTPPGSPLCYRAWRTKPPQGLYMLFEWNFLINNRRIKLTLTHVLKLKSTSPNSAYSYAFKWLLVRSIQMKHHLSFSLLIQLKDSKLEHITPFTTTKTYLDDKRHCNTSRLGRSQEPFTLKNNGTLSLFWVYFLWIQNS